MQKINIGNVRKIGAKDQASRGSETSSSGFGKNTSSRSSFSHNQRSNNFKGQTYWPWRHKEVNKNKPNNKRQSQ